jgi:predicted metal-dependent phosphoesterase TrpH
MTNDTGMASLTRVDFHVHTTFGSPDSTLKPGDVAGPALRRGIGVVVFAEHSDQWTVAKAEEFSKSHGLVAIAAREWSSPWGHIIILGLETGSPWVQRNPRLQAVVDRVEAGDAHVHPRGSVATMREIVDDHDGYMIIAHPFRYFPGANSLLFGEMNGAHAWSALELSRHPVFEFMDEIEVKNGGCNSRDNALAREVADVLGKTGIAGSDAHSAFTVGLCSTTFTCPVDGPAALLAGLRAGEFRTE